MPLTIGNYQEPFTFENTKDPRKLTVNNRALIQQRGDALTQQGADVYQGEQALRGDTADYLGGLEAPLAEGKGGYNPDEMAQIKMTPEQQQGIVTSAGISAGAPTAAAVGAAERSANAAGGSPMALATYRARAARTMAGDAGDAMTKARVAASDAAAGRAENIGGARIGQQNTGLQYYQGQNQQANQNAQNALELQQQAYGTQANAGNAATKTGLEASQTPSTFDKILGAASGALKFLDEGEVVTSPTPAVIGENGPEQVVPVGQPEPQVPFWKRAQDNFKRQSMSQGSGGGTQRPFNPVDTYSQLGEAAGGLAKTFLGGGEADGGIFTKPTAVLLGERGPEQVVPMDYRAKAKVRPSAAVPRMHPPQTRGVYGGSATGLTRI